MHHSLLASNLDSTRETLGNTNRATLHSTSRSTLHSTSRATLHSASRAALHNTVPYLSQNQKTPVTELRVWYGVDRVRLHSKDSAIFILHTENSWVFAMKPTELDCLFRGKDSSIYSLYNYCMERIAESLPWSRTRLCFIAKTQLFVLSILHSENSWVFATKPNSAPFVSWQDSGIHSLFIT